jgi:DNA-binding transcriptional regulator YiaG
MSRRDSSPNSATRRFWLTPASALVRSIATKVEADKPKSSDDGRRRRGRNVSVKHTDEKVITAIRAVRVYGERQSVVADRMGIGRATLSQWLDGSNRGDCLRRVEHEIAEAARLRVSRPSS